MFEFHMEGYMKWSSIPTRQGHVEILIKGCEKSDFEYNANYTTVWKHRFE